MKKILLSLCLALTFSVSAFAADKVTMLSDGTSLTYETPCRMVGYTEIGPCLIVDSIYESKTGNFDVNYLNSFQGNGHPKSLTVILVYNANRTEPMEVMFNNLQSVSLTWENGISFDHMTIPNDGTYELIFVTTDNAKSWTGSIRILQPGYSQ
jgi:hypothetical protein